MPADAGESHSLSNNLSRFIPWLIWTPLSGGLQVSALGAIGVVGASTLSPVSTVLSEWVAFPAGVGVCFPCQRGHNS